MERAELLQQVQAAAALDRATAERVTWATMVMPASAPSTDLAADIDVWVELGTVNPTPRTR